MRDFKLGTEAARVEVDVALALRTVKWEDNLERREEMV
jgi:hypothetical protein